MSETYRSGGVPSSQVGESAVPVAAAPSRVEFHSHDLDETREYVRKHHADHSRVVHGTGRYLYRLSALVAGRIIIGRTERWMRQTLRSAVPQPTLFLSLEPGETIAYGRKSYRFQPDRAIFSVPGHEYTRTGGNDKSLIVRVESGLLEREIDARLRRQSRRWLMPSTPISMTAARRAELLSFEAQLRAAAVRGSWGAYGDLGTFEHALAGWLAGLVLEAAGAQATNEPGLERIARVQRWIDAHLDQEITLDRLCAVAGFGPRSLQKAFVAARGLTPHEFVTARRLAAARRRLESASSPVRVSAVALDCGFRHFGRFAVSYRAAFGESPTQTVRAGAPREDLCESPNRTMYSR